MVESLARRVQRLEHHQQRVGVACPQQLLGLGELLHTAGQQLFGRAAQLPGGQLLELRPPGPARIAAGDVRLRSRLDDELLGDAFASAHGNPLPLCPGSSSVGGRWPASPAADEMAPPRCPMRQTPPRGNSPGRDGDDAVVRDDASVLMGLGRCQGTGVLDMSAVRYAVRVRGRHSDAAMAASQEGLDVAVVPMRTVLRGRLPDQAALLGVLARARLLGLELIEVRRQAQGALREDAARGRSAPPAVAR
jgi:hypothetical protein